MNSRSHLFLWSTVSLLLLLAAAPASGSGSRSQPSFRPVQDEIWVKASTLTGKSGLAGAYGFSVDVGGDIAVVGDRNIGIDGVGHAGAAFVYERNEGTGGWSEVKRLIAPEPHACGHFGAAVAVTESADTIIVGEEGRRDHPACKQNGAIYFFGRDEGGQDNWGLIKVIDGSGQYGNPLRVDGDTLVVGVPGDQASGITCANGSVVRPQALAGFVQIFKRNEGGVDNWGMVKAIQSPSTSEVDKYFGCSVAIGGNRLAVGAPDHGEMGKAYLYDGNNDWGLIATVDGFQRWNTLGFAVAVSGEHAFVSAPFEQKEREVDDDDTDWAGQVYSFGSSSGLPYPQMPEPDPSHFVGTAIALDGDFLAVSYNGTNETDVSDDVLIYRNTNHAGWELVQVLKDIGPECWSSMSIAIDGDTLIVGETGCTGIGRAHIFERSFGSEKPAAFLPLVAVPK